MNGHAHTAASLLLSVPVGIATGLALGDTAAGILTAAGCLAGILLSPDLDQESITESEAVIYRSLGDVAGLGHLGTPASGSRAGCYVGLAARLGTGRERHSSLDHGRAVER